MSATRSVVTMAVLFAVSSCGSPDDTASNSQSETVELNAVADGQSAAALRTAPKLWVTAERINRHTCPSTSCGVVGTLDFREAATVSDQKNGWARVSRYYDASCVNGTSEFVEKGNASCKPNNGIVDGKFSEWVQANHLSATRPEDPAETAAVDEALIKDSDDFVRHRRAFVKAAQELTSSGQCTSADFQEMGGFMKSQNHKSEPVYFTYCGGMTLANRIYLNAKTGKIYR